MRPRVYFCSAAMLACFILVGASSASAQHIQDRGYFREATSAAYAQLPFICTAPDCVSYPTDAYTTDYAVAQVITIVGAVDGETFTFKAVEPDSTVLTEWVITYHSTQCFTWSGGSLCNNSGYATFWTGPLVNCQPTGSWTLQFYDNSTLTVTHQFNLSHNASGPLGITSPTANQLIQLTDQNYTATPSSGAGAALFSAGTNGGGTISWTATQSYNTSQGYGYTTSNLPPFNTANGQGQVEIYQSTGGQVKVTAQTTTSSGTVQDCVTFYVEGTQLFDPTGQLLSLYATGATPHLMTGIAQVESSYLQFFSQNLLGATALWPHESYDGGSHIGLMMVPITNADAWDWTINTSDGVNSSVYGFAANKLPTATTYTNDIINGVKNPKIPRHIGLRSLTGVELENMALVLYRGVGLGPDLASTLTELYYVPICSSNNVISRARDSSVKEESGTGSRIPEVIL